MILITGANGLLGSYLTNELLSQNYEVVGLVREDSDLSLLDQTNQNLHLHKGDILDITSLQELFKVYPVKKVVHAAAVVSYQPKDYERMYQINVEGTKNIVNISLENEVKKFLHVSSVAALGRSSNGTIDENTSWSSSGYNSKYGVSKKEAELEVWRAQMEGLKTVIINPSLILAPGDGNRSSSRFFSFIKTESLFYPTGNLNYVDIRDVTEIAIKLLKSDIENNRFIVNAGTISFKDFFIKAADHQGLKAPKIPVKKITGRLALLMDKIRSKVGNKEPMLSAESLRVSRSKIRFDNSKIKGILNFQFRSLDESIKWVWQEFNS
ncbi:MAG: NAD-dependent epimerase/dehydratase family protein [Candidatus Cyclobacteriaceae bacterium M2_1C_046]